MSLEANKYIEYFEIDEGYYPEINESSIKDPKNKWQETFPHLDIVRILNLLERVLSRNEKKSIWIEGAYGTGKSRIIWMLQNLLSCSDSEFCNYFLKYQNLKNEIDLRERLRNLRRGHIVSATRYATGNITSTQKLIFVVFETLTAALQNAGLKFDGAKTLRGKIVSWLEADPANLEMFRSKIQKTEYQNYATFANRSAEEIIERLKNPNTIVAQLVEDILKLGENEGIRAFSIDMQNLTDWISEVIEVNHLTALILFWDEFSKFFSHNKNNLDEFQRLAELSNIVPFYLVIATHQSESLAADGDMAFKIVSDRFVHVEISMPDNIALELIGHALKIKEVAKNNWLQMTAALRERTAIPRKAVMNLHFVKINDEKVLTDILPIHPLTAILLKNLAVYFASNQRSIFNFIKNTDPNIQAFQYFIANKSPENGDLLTIDYLWNFFYESGTDELGRNIGRMNLTPSVRAILDTYSQNKDSLSADEQIILKTVLLFQAINQASHGEVAIFQPTENNLNLAFIGSPTMDNGFAVAIANNLVKKNILFKKSGKVESFAAMAVGGNFNEIEILKNSILENVTTSALVENAKVLDSLRLTPAQKIRYSFFPLTVDNFSLTVNRASKNSYFFQIAVVICFARNEGEYYKIQNFIRQISENNHCHKLAIIDASSNYLNSEIFNQWLANSANEKYWRGKDNSLADKMKENADDCLQDWCLSFETGQFVFYPALKNPNLVRTKINCQNLDAITNELQNNVTQVFQFSFDEANINDSLFLATNLKRLAEAGIKQEEFSMLKLRDIKNILPNIWEVNVAYWEIYPELPISQLKIQLDSLIQSEFAKKGRVSFDTILEFLISVGFMPLNIYSFLTGFLMKEYADEPYRFSENNSGGAMFPTKLAEIIADTFKQFSNSNNKNYHLKYLEILSPNQQNFISFIQKIFEVNDVYSVEQTAKVLRLKLKNLGVPLWCYVDNAEKKYREFLNILTSVAVDTQNINLSTLTERAGLFLSKNPATVQYFQNFLSDSNGRHLFSDFIARLDDGLVIEMAKKIEVENIFEECQQRLMTPPNSWMQAKEASVANLKNLIVEYQIVLESRKFEIFATSLDSCILNWQTWCRLNLKIPADALGDYFSTVKTFFSILKELVERGELPQNKREVFLEQLKKNATAINTAISEPLQFLRAKYSYQLKGINDAELQNLYYALPNNSFIDSQGHYHKNLVELAKKIRSNQLKNQLLDLWNNLANNKSPREWSAIHRTPILAMVPISEQENVTRIFDAILNPSPAEKDVVFAIDYLKNTPTFFSTLNDPQQIESAFRNVIIGEKYRGFLDDNDAVRNEIEANFSGHPFHWFPNILINKIVEQFAENKYYTGDAHDRVTAQVMKMSDKEAKTLLIELLDKNYEIGLKLLRGA